MEMLEMLPLRWVFGLGQEGLGTSSKPDRALSKARAPWFYGIWYMGLLWFKWLKSKSNYLPTSTRCELSHANPDF